MRKQVLKRHADPVRRRHLDIPRQARVVQFHIWRRRLSDEPRKIIDRDGAFQLAEQDAPEVITEVPEDRGFPECGETNTVVQSPRSCVDCQSTRISIYYYHGISKKKDGQRDIGWVGGERTYLVENSSRETGWVAVSSRQILAFENVASVYLDDHTTVLLPVPSDGLISSAT
jgi:hypothetical protein